MAEDEAAALPSVDERARQASVDAMGIFSRDQSLDLQKIVEEAARMQKRRLQPSLS